MSLKAPYGAPMATEVTPAPPTTIGRAVNLAAAVAVLRRRAQIEILLVHLDLEGGDPYADAWVLPGGAPAPGETLADAAVREVKATAGLLMEPDALEWLWELPAVSADGDRYRTHYFTGFAPEVIDLASARTSIAELKWLTIDAAYRASTSHRLIIPPATTEVLRRLSNKEFN